MRKPRDKTKVTKRSRAKYPALDPRLNSRVRQEKIDFDYLNLLNEDEKAWLNRFVSEEITAHFENDGKDFSKTKEDRKKIYDRNNGANRCMYGLTKGKVANTKLIEYGSDIEDELAQGINPSRLEDAYIDFIDGKQMEELEKFALELDALEDYAEYLDTKDVELLQESQEPLPSDQVKPQKS